ncbi:MAG: accessory factor UbiK family protein [Pseudomonadota bacterium]
MQTKHRLFDDLAKVGMGLLGLGLEIRQDIKRKVCLRLERRAAEFGFVSREEFEVVKAMVQKARQESEVSKAAPR